MKCEVLVDRCSLVVGKGSIVEIDERQFELARNFVKPVGARSKKSERPTDGDGEEDKRAKKN